MVKAWSLLFILLAAGQVRAQDTVTHAQPIEGISPDSLSFYDRLDQQLKGRNLNYDNRDSSFNWMIGNWSINAKGYARNGFRGKKEFQWQEPFVSFTRDQNYSIYVSTNETIRQTSLSDQKLVPMPPQVILQYDVYGNVWVLQAGYYNRYDWGSLVSSGWTGNQIVFEGAISLTGIKLVERETWTRASDDEFRIVYEELMNDGTWFTIEENTYKRLK